jgi:hypothetical protein
MGWKMLSKKWNGMNEPSHPFHSFICNAYKKYLLCSFVFIFGLLKIAFGQLAIWGEEWGDTVEEKLLKC